MKKKFIHYLSQRGQDFIASFSGGYTGGDGDGVDRVPLLHQLWNHRHLKTPLFRVQIQHVDRKTTPGLQQIRQVHHVLFKNIFSRQTTRRQFHLVPGDQNRARMGYNTDQYTTHDQSRKTSRPLLLLKYNTYPALAQAATKGPPLKEVVGVIPATTMGGLPVNAVNFVTNSP